MANAIPQRGVGKRALAACGLAVVVVVATVLLLDRDATPGAPAVGGSTEPASNDGLTARAEVPASALLSRPPAREGADAIALDVEVVELTDDARGKDDAADGPKSPEPARIIGSIDKHGYFGKAVSVSFVAGLNAGKDAAVVDNTAYAFDDLLPGVGVLQLAFGDKKYLREVNLKRGRPLRLDFNVEHRNFALGSLTDNLTNLPIVRAMVDIDGSRQYSSAKGDFEILDPIDGDTLFYTSAKGYEYRRTVVRWGSHRSGQIEPVNIAMRRSTPIVVQFEGLTGDDDPPVAVIVPHGLSAPTTAFEKCCVVTGRKGVKEYVIEGIPSDEEVHVRMLATSAIATPSYKVLTALDPAATAGRVARFTFASSKPLRGQVLYKGVPIEGALVKVEAVDPAASTESFFGATAFAKFPFPMLPCARKQVDTNEDGEFSVEVADIRLPARITIEKLGLEPVNEAVPTGSFNMGTIELRSSPSEAAAADFPSALILEFPDAKPRALTVSYLAAGKVKPTIREMSSSGYRSQPISVAPGPHRVRIGKGPTAQVLTIAAKGETTVKVGKTAGAGH